MGYESSLDEDVVEQNVDDCVMAGVDFAAHFSAVAHDVLCIERQPRLAAKSTLSRPSSW